MHLRKKGSLKRIVRTCNTISNFLWRKMVPYMQKIFEKSTKTSHELWTGCSVFLTIMGFAYKIRLCKLYKIKTCVWHVNFHWNSRGVLPTIIFSARSLSWAIPNGKLLSGKFSKILQNNFLYQFVTSKIGIVESIIE